MNVATFIKWWLIFNEVVMLWVLMLPQDFPDRP